MKMSVLIPKKAVAGQPTIMKQQLLPEDIGNLAHQSCARWLLEFHEDIVANEFRSHVDCKLK